MLIKFKNTQHYPKDVLKYHLQIEDMHHHQRFLLKQACAKREYHRWLLA